MSEIVQLLESIDKARERNADLDVRIILGKLFGPDDVKKEKKNVANLRSTHDLRLDRNIRYIDTKRFVHCHNKLIIVDDKSVLVSSQNWSGTGVDTNREAGVLIEHAGCAKYFSKIFESDWSTALKRIPTPGRNRVAPETVARGNFIQVVPADYQEV